MNWDYSPRKLLIVGIGGGSDIVCAYGLSTLVVGARAVAWANTKRSDAMEPAVRMDGKRYVWRVSEWKPEGESVDVHGTTRIDHAVPRGEGGCPLLFALDKPPGGLGDEIRSLGYDEILAVDIGGDSLNGRPGRDAEMLGVLRSTGLPMRHVVIAPGVDGESEYEELEGPMRRVRSRFALEPIVGVLREYGARLGPGRTPNLVVAAHEGRFDARGDGFVRVPRDREPWVPLEWLLHGYEVEGA